MQLSQTVEYALRAVVWLAQYTDDEAQPTQAIADGTQIPGSYLSKVLQGLGRAGFVKGQRGLHGGFTLTRSVDDITVLDVVNAVDPVQRIGLCPLKFDSHGPMLCPLHSFLDQGMRMVEDHYRSKTVGDLLRTPGRSRPLCVDDSKPAMQSITIGSSGE